MCFDCKTLKYFAFLFLGTVLICSTPDDPSVVIPLLRRKQATSSVISKGHYKLVGDSVNIVYKRITKGIGESRSRRGRNVQPPVTEHVFYMVSWCYRIIEDLT